MLCFFRSLVATGTFVGNEVKGQICSRDVRFCTSLGRAFAVASKTKLWQQQRNFTRQIRTSASQIGNDNWHFLILTAAWVQPTNPNICFDFYQSVFELHFVVSMAYDCFISSFVGNQVRGEKSCSNIWFCKNLGRAFAVASKTKLWQQQRNFTRKIQTSTSQIRNDNWHFLILPAAWVQPTSPNVCFDFYQSFFEFHFVVSMVYDCFMSSVVWIWCISFTFSSLLLCKCRFNVNSIVPTTILPHVWSHDIEI